MKVESVWLSIIVPVHNAATWLPACLDSIAAQTETSGWECILVDDGSADGSGRLCDERAAADPRFRVIHQANGGVSAARNTGIEAARGDYLLFVDADDRVSPRLAEYAGRLQRQEPEAMVLWPFVRSAQALAENAAAPLESVSLPKEALDGYAYLNILYNAVWQRLFRRQAIENAHLRFDLELGRAGASMICEDGEFVLQYLRACRPAQGWKMVLCRNALYEYRTVNEQSLSTTVRPGTKEDKQAMTPRPDIAERLHREWDGLLAWEPDFPEQYFAPQGSLVRYYLRSAAEACAAGRLDRELRRHPCLNALRSWCRRHKEYSPYIFWLRPGLFKAAGWLWKLDASHSRWFGRIDWAGYYLLGGNWNR